MKSIRNFILVSAALLSFLTCAAGLAVMSVDFGTEFMKIALVKPGVPMEIVLNKESSRKTPTVVTIKNGERFFAEAALNMGMRFPKNGYRCLIDLIGKSYDNPLVTKYRERFPFYDLQKDPETGSVLFLADDGTKYSPEELVAMMLQKAREYAENFAEQPVTEAVVTVPVYFNQAERRAMNRSVELSGLKLLQLMNDNTAVALQYGIFRRKQFNETAVNYMFFDMGASATTATVISYQVVKVKLPASGIVDKHPQMTVRGVGFDRTLGGSEFQQRLAHHLAKQFTATKKTKRALTDDPRAMMKLYKEAGRVKQILSANVDHFAQVEGLLDDEDFRVKVTREEFETICADLFPRIKSVIKSALDMSEMSMEEITEVVLMGGGTRIPKVQQVLREAIGREELGKGLNTDEAAALGAVYQAAHLSKGFKVQTFAIKDTTLYPIQVEFERVRLGEEESKDTTKDSPKIIKRTLFGRGGAYPQKKVMTFNKHVKDFSFEVNYGDLGFLNKEQLLELGNSTLQTVSLKGVEEAYNKHSGKPTDENEPATESKGVKAHFRVDDSGILHLDRVESVFERPAVAGGDAEESTLSKIGNTISNLFGGGKKEETETKDDAGSSTAEEVEAGSGKEEEKEKTEAGEGSQQTKSEDDKAQTNATESETNKTTEAAGEGKNETDTDLDKKTKKLAKTQTVREEINMEVALRDLLQPTDDRIKLSHKLISDMDKKDKEKGLLEKVKNEIESFIFDTQDKLEQKDYELCSKEEERISISEKLATASDWLNEQGDDTPRKDFEHKLKEMKSLTKDIEERVKEKRERPAAVAALRDLVNHTEFFLAGMKNYTGATTDEFPFTQVEYDTLEKLIKDTKEWNRTVHEDQAKTALYEKPKFTVEDVAMKMSALDREIKYLVNKAKLFRPKPKPKNETSSANETNSANATKPASEKKSDKKETKQEERKKEETIDPLDKDILEEAESKAIEDEKLELPSADSADSEKTSDKKPEDKKKHDKQQPNDEL